MENNRTRFIDKTLRLVWVFRIVLFLILIGLASFGYQYYKTYAMRNTAIEALQSERSNYALALARTIAVTSREDILKSRFDVLQDYFSNIAQSSSNVAYIAIMTPDGTAVVHTDTKYRGKKLTDNVSEKAISTEKPIVQQNTDKKLFDADVPVMSYTQKAAVIRVGVSYANVDKELK